MGGRVPGGGRVRRYSEARELASRTKKPRPKFFLAIFSDPPTASLALDYPPRVRIPKQTPPLRPGLVLVVPAGLVALLSVNISQAAQIPIGSGTTIWPPVPMAAIEFVKESGVERWQVKLTRGGNVGEVRLRIFGASCSHMGEIYQGMITPLYEGMTFKTKNGRTCTVQAIEY